MKPQERQEYINWLLFLYPNKAHSYFEKLSDKELINEYEKERSNY